MNETDKELAELEKQINEKKAEEVKAPPVVEEQPEVPEPTPTQEVPPTQETPEETGFNATEWVKKKGWKTPEDAAKSLREMEKAMHEKNQELARIKENQGYQPPPQGYAPPPPPYQPPAYTPQPNYGYQPPVNPYSPQRPNEEQIAQSYGMSVEDFRRVLAVSRDISEVQVRQLAMEQQRMREEQQRLMDRNSDMMAVTGDEAFRNPDVQYEMHEILSKNPTVWNERKPYSSALKEALANLGRKKLMGIDTQSVNLPNTPPVMAGANSSRGSAQGKRFNAMPDMKTLEGKSPEEIEKILKSFNAVRTYQDMM